MQRRTFLRCAAGTVFGVRTISSVLASSASAPRPMGRIGCTTVSFRQRFASTRAQGEPAGGPDLALLDVPALFTERLGIRNVEVWSKHFTERTIAYGEKLRAAAERAGARIINVQLDEPPFDLCEADATRRWSAIESVKQWMDVAAGCGASSLRANTGGRPGGPFVLATAVDSYRRLADYAERIGLKVLVENHGGYSADLGNVAAIVAGVKSRACRTLPDFGNFPAGIALDERLAQLRRILPDAELVSAKGMEFDADYRHTSFDVAPCVRAAEQSGFRGIYSIELWSPTYVPAEPERAVATMKEIIVRELAATRT